MDGDLVAFLSARLDEDEADAPNQRDPARVLREVAFKRAMLSMFLDAFGNRLNMTIYGAVGGFTMNGDWVLREMAAIYGDHPDYRQEWVP